MALEDLTHAQLIAKGYTTKEFSTPTKKTSKTHSPSPENTVLLFSVQPCGDAKATGTPTTNKKDSAINANNVNWKRRVINCILKSIRICSNFTLKPIDLSSDFVA